MEGEGQSVVDVMNVLQKEMGRKRGDEERKESDMLKRQGVEMCREGSSVIVHIVLCSRKSLEFRV